MASTSHNPTSPRPHVFLSFRGPDTKNRFIDHLFKDLTRLSIETYMADAKLRSGEVITDSLIQAIHDSEIHIVVLSENYASSSWCLGELEEILACYKQMKKSVIPVFYHIEPKVVRHQNSASFEEAFKIHQGRAGSEKVRKWRDALTEVSEFSGFNITTNSSEADVIDKIIERVLDEITPITLDVAEFPVGLDSHVKVVTELFNTVKEGVNRIGIYGMGGVGKTTLAKAVYNRMHRCFSGSCFLANVSEVSRTKGLASLQQKLVSDVLKREFKIDDADRGINSISGSICSTKVLVVIDDLDNSDHLRYLEGPFALGSVVIITTRNEILLDDIGVKAKYMVNEMSEDESHKLFAQHAFREDKIPDRFAELSKEILKRVGGLPLALAVCGSALFNKPEEGWNWYICRLKEAPITGVEEKLMISFDALKLVDPDLQNIFLDIACFCIGINNDMVFRIMESCYEYVPYRIDILKKRCLITVSEHGDLRMHDLLCDMGRNIARNNCPDKPGKHSRLWVSKDIDTVLDDHKGTKAIQGIIPEKFSLFYYNYIGAREVKFDAESFKRMSDLRLLYLNNVNITGSFKKKFEKLRWLCWEYCPLECLPSEFYPQKLVTLELRCSKMKAVWDPNMVPGVLEKLKSLNMQRSSNLTTTPDFTRLPCLQTLDLSGCVSLKEVHVSIGSLASLVSLDLGHCENLRSLPDSICSLRALKVLNIDYCKSLKALPTELGNIVSLKVLKASNLCVSKLPYSIERLGNLVELHLHGNKNLETLPDSICKLRSLQILDIVCCEKLEELPDQLGMITSLRNLRVRGLTMLKKIPDISQLSNIEDLDLTDCHHLLSIVELPPNLNLLWICSCRSLKRVPDLSHLKQLEELQLDDCSGLTEIKGLQELTCLPELDLEDCGDLLSISELPPNLKSIRAGYCTSLKRLPKLSNLKQLKELNLEDCSGLTEIKGLEELTSLKYLILKGCNSSLLASTLTIGFFQILSGFGHTIQIQIGSFEFEESSKVFGSRMSFDLQPSASYNLKGIIFCLSLGDECDDPEVTYSIKHIRSGFVWIGEIEVWDYAGGSVIVIVPSSDLLIEDGHNTLEVISSSYEDLYADEISCGIHLVYETEIKMISGNKVEDDWYNDSESNNSDNDSESNNSDNDSESNNSDNEKGERIKPSEHNLERTTVNVEDERSKPSDNDLESNKKWSTLGSSSTNVNVEEGRSPPSKRLKRWECDSNWLSL